jgi:hypothetical protein
MSTAARPIRLAILDADGDIIDTMPLTVRDSTRPFTSGSVGYFCSGKLSLRSVSGDEARHQISMSAVETNSKSEALAAVAAERRSKKQQLLDQIALLREQAKLSA